MVIEHSFMNKSYTAKIYIYIYIYIYVYVYVYIYTYVLYIASFCDDPNYAYIRYYVKTLINQLWGNISSSTLLKISRHKIMW